MVTDSSDDRIQEVYIEAGGPGNSNNETPCKSEVGMHDDITSTQRPRPLRSRGWYNPGEPNDLKTMSSHVQGQDKIKSQIQERVFLFCPLKTWRPSKTRENHSPTC